MAALVTAIPTPHPVYGKVTADGFAVRDAELQIKTRIGTTETITNENGFYQFEMANIDGDWRAGDSITVSLKYCAGTSIECSKTISLADTGGTEVSWDISTITDSSGQTIPIPDYIQVLRIQCQDGSLVSDISQCPLREPEPEEDTSLPYKIALGILAGLIAIAAAVISKFKWGKGFLGLSNYWKKG